MLEVQHILYTLPFFRSGILVRMITGDSTLTAVAIARECGILDRNEQYHENSFKIMEGSKFRALVGGIETI